MMLNHFIYNTLCIFRDITYGLKYTYVVKEQKILLSQKEKSITRTSVDQALQVVQELNRQVSDPEMLEVSGVAYLYPVFIRLGLICHTE